jgi:hypothetical protein
LTSLKEGRTVYFKINNLNSIDNIKDFIITVPNDYSINFFDNFYPLISDLGAYVSVQKLFGNNSFAYFIANHGWSTEWRQFDLNDLINYIHKNRDFNNGILKIDPIKKRAEIGKRLGEY